MSGEHSNRNNRLARRAGFKNYQEYLDALTDKDFRGYRSWLRIGAENLSAETGLDYQEAWREVRKLDSEFHRKFSKAAKSGFSEGGLEYEGKDMHEFLTYLGLRDDLDWWGVGDTPDL